MRAVAVALICWATLVGCAEAPSPIASAAAPVSSLQTPASSTALDGVPVALHPAFVRLLDTGPVAGRCGFRPPRPLWRRTLSAIADGIGFSDATKRAVYAALPDAISHTLRR